MSEERIRIVGETVMVGSRRYELPHPVREAFVLSGLLIVLYDPDSNIKPWGQFPNLVALREDGELAWEGELPTTHTGDSYYRVFSREPLVVGSVKSFRCRIDPTTGKILSKEFVK